MVQAIRYGGTFAPPLTDAILASYRAMAEGLSPSPVKDAMLILLGCCEKWWDMPESNGTVTRPHPSGAGTIVPLEGAIATELFDHIPWEHELDAIQGLLDGIDNETQKPLRDAAFHLLWHVKELNLDREPITADKV